MMCVGRWVALTSLERFILDDNVDERIAYGIESLRQSSAGKMVKLTKASVDTSLRAVLVATRHLCYANLRDKVHAILYVAVSGHESVEADYTIPLCTLLKEVLVHMKEFHQRESFADVDQECSFLEQVFGLWHESLYWTGQLWLR
jgi:hypothetical protein